MKPLILYHGECYDGFGAAWAAWRRYGHRADYQSCIYGQDPPSVEGRQELFLLDFTYPRDVLMTWAVRGTSINVLDHHLTAEKTLAASGAWPPTNCHILIDKEKSGARLAWEHFHSQSPNDLVPELIRHIEDRDLWRFALSDTKAIHMALQMYPFDFEVWDEICHDIPTLKREGEICLRLSAQQVDTICRNTQWKVIGGHTVPAVNTSLYSSEVCHRLCDRYPEAPFTAYYFDRGDGKRQWGLRSVGDFDVSAVAEQYGGGGHKNASGFEEDVP